MIPLLSFQPWGLSRCSDLPDLVTDWWVLKGHKVRDPEEISHVALCTMQMFLMGKDFKSRLYSFHILIKCVELFNSPSSSHHLKSYLLAPPAGQLIQGSRLIRTWYVMFGRIWCSGDADWQFGSIQLEQEWRWKYTAGSDITLIFFYPFFFFKIYNCIFSCFGLVFVHLLRVFWWGEYCVCLWLFSNYTFIWCLFTFHLSFNNIKEVCSRLPLKQ